MLLAERKQNRRRSHPTEQPLLFHLEEHYMFPGFKIPHFGKAKEVSFWNKCEPVKMICSSCSVRSDQNTVKMRNKSKWTDLEPIIISCHIDISCGTLLKTHMELKLYRLSTVPWNWKPSLKCSGLFTFKSSQMAHVFNNVYQPINNA